jgi:hypothetical protein
LVLPTYIPKGLSTSPGSDYGVLGGDIGTAFIMFWSPDRNSETRERPYLKGVVVEERFPDDLVRCADDQVVNLDPEYRCVDTRVGDSDVVAEAVPFADDETHYSFEFTRDDVLVSLDFLWVFSQGGSRELPNDLEREAMRMIQSMLEQQEG